MSCLIIAEKPSVAQAIARVLDARNKRPGYIEGSGFIVSWCIGHLVELAQPEAYDERYAKWRRDDLPILPASFKHVVSERTKKQFDALKKLMDRKDVDTIVCATDAGREGELIFRLVYEMCGCTKPIKRLWISSLEESAIREGFRNLRDSREFDSLYHAALCRSQADWIVGLNMTRLMTTMYGQTLHVGRVMTPTLAMVVEREQAIREFTPEPFYTVSLSGNIEAQTERITDKDEAMRIMSSCQGQSAQIVSIKRQKKSQNPPLPYDLTSLQRDANRLFGYSAQQTLDYAQSLYEKKLLTYPRTDSRYLVSDMEESLPALAQRVAASLPFAQRLALPVNPAQIICDGKVTDHHALIPTQSMPGMDFADLPEGERVILQLVAVRLLCSVGNPYLYEETEIEIECAGHTFTTKGKTVLQQGWRAAENAFRMSMGNRIENDEEERPPADFSYPYEGQTLYAVNCQMHEGKTTPPKRYTEDTLLAAMESAGAHDMTPEVERKGIGTPATRAGIIEKLCKTGLMERSGNGKRKQLVPTQKGITLISVLPEAICSAAMTADWERQLLEIERGRLSDAEFLAAISAMVSDQVRSAHPAENAETLFPSNRRKVGTCPVCGGAVTESPKGFFCDGPACHFRLFKDNRFFTNRGKTLDAETMTALLEDGHARVQGFVSQKTGKPYDGIVHLEPDEEGNARIRVSLA